MIHTLPDPRDYVRLMDEAKAEASRLRSQAIQHFGVQTLGELGQGVARLRAWLQGRQAPHSANARNSEAGA
jgi:hypothetical protein